MASGSPSQLHGSTTAGRGHWGGDGDRYARVLLSCRQRESGRIPSLLRTPHGGCEFTVSPVFTRSCRISRFGAGPAAGRPEPGQGRARVSSMGPRRRLAALATGVLALTIAACSGGSGPAGSGPGGTAGTPAASHAGSRPGPASPGGPASPAQHLTGPPLPSGMTALTPAQLRRAYDVDPLLRRGVARRGQTNG